MKKIFLQFFTLTLLFLAGSLVAQTPEATAQSMNKITFQGNELETSAPCEGNNYSITTNDGLLMVVIVNAPESGTANLNDDFFTKGCAECLLLQVIKVDDGTEFRGLSGKITHEGKKISFQVQVYTEADPDTKIDLKGEVVCQE
ncbi:MAG: hypothetical protein EAZ97_04135 [Bacteroidetes bacterium]|nr:MAG: hypothetical protein EAZ97_04135 [Bacteroidota bacterium]